MLAAATDDIDSALGHFDDSLRFLSARRFGPEEAICRTGLARVLIESGRVESARRARSELTLAIMLARSLGMPPVIRRARRYLGQLPAAVEDGSPP